MDLSTKGERHFSLNKGLWASEQMHHTTFYHLYTRHLRRSDLLKCTDCDSALTFLRSNFETWSYMSETRGDITTTGVTEYFIPQDIVSGGIKYPKYKVSGLRILYPSNFRNVFAHTVLW